MPTPSKLLVQLRLRIQKASQSDTTEIGYRMAGPLSFANCKAKVVVAQRLCRPPAAAVANVRICFCIDGERPVAVAPYLDTGQRLVEKSLAVLLVKLARTRTLFERLVPLMRDLRTRVDRVLPQVVSMPRSLTSSAMVRW